MASAEGASFPDPREVVLNPWIRGRAPLASTLDPSRCCFRGAPSCPGGPQKVVGSFQNLNNGSKRFRTVQNRSVSQNSNTSNHHSSSVTHPPTTKLVTLNTLAFGMYPASRGLLLSLVFCHVNSSGFNCITGSWKREWPVPKARVFPIRGRWC